MHAYQQSTLSEAAELADFARQAAEYFSGSPLVSTFSRSNIVPGSLFAVRWGCNDRSVLVFRVGEMVPINFVGAIKP